jgi:hypothetical protein
MATAVLAPAKWNTGRRLYWLNSKLPAQTSHLNNIQKWREEEALRVAEETGNFLTITHGFIVEQFVTCPLPRHAPNRQEVGYFNVTET